MSRRWLLIEVQGQYDCGGDCNNLMSHICHNTTYVTTYVTTFSNFLQVFCSVLSAELVALFFISLNFVAMQQTRSHILVVGIPGGRNLLIDLLIS